MQTGNTSWLTVADVYQPSRLYDFEWVLGARSQLPRLYCTMPCGGNLVDSCDPLIRKMPRKTTAMSKNK